MKYLVSFAVACIIVTAPAFAQDETPLNRLSVDVTLSNVMGLNSGAFGPLTGSLGRSTRYINPNLNLGVRYAFSPVVSVQGNLGFTQLRGSESRHPNHPYTSTFTNIGAQANLYFLRAFETYRSTRILNPFIHFGVGASFGKVTNLPNDREENIRHGFFNGGIGTLIRLPGENFISDRVDFILQYNYQSFRGNNIDGYPQFSGWDRGSRLAAFGFGISVKLGPSQYRHADWHIGHSKVDEAIRIAREVEARQNQLEQRVEVVEDKQENEHGEFHSRLEALEAERDEMYDFEALEQSQYEANLKIQMLIDRVNALESRVVDYPGTVGVGRGDVVPSGVSRGHYVQVYAGARQHHADGALAIIRELFEDVHGMDNLNYIIHKPHQYYVVQIGPYNQLGDTDDILRKAKEVFDDSFIRTYR